MIYVALTDILMSYVSSGQFYDTLMVLDVSCDRKTWVDGASFSPLSYQPFRYLSSMTLL